MQVVMCEAYGEPDSLVVKDVPSPEAGPGQVKIRLRARGVSYTDVLRIAGKYQVKDTPPFIPGGEAAGEIIALGADVKGLAVGDRVLSGGGFAEETVQAASSVVKLPATVGFEAAASFRSNYLTAYYGLQRGRLKAGETLLVHGAAGGVGLAAVDMGKLLGARVIATARSAERLEVCKQLGADHVVDYSKGFREEVKELTGGKGADVIYDPVGGDVFDESMRCIAPFGRILIVGFTGGRPGEAKTNHLAGQRCRSHRLHRRRLAAPRSGLVTAQSGGSGGLAGLGAHSPLSLARPAAGQGHGRAQTDPGPQGDGESVAGVTGGRLVLEALHPVYPHVRHPAEDFDAVARS